MQAAAYQHQRAYIKFTVRLISIAIVVHHVAGSPCFYGVTPRSSFDGRTPYQLYTTDTSPYRIPPGYHFPPPGQIIAAGEPTVCVQYREGMPGGWKWTYAVLPSSECTTYIQAASSSFKNISNVVCCSSSLCNKPDPLLDSAAVPVTSYNITCLSTVEVGYQVDPHDPTTASVPPAAVALTSATTLPSADGRLDAVVCASYKYNRCRGTPSVAQSPVHMEAPRFACNATEQASGVWVWAYHPATATACEDLRAVVSTTAANMSTAFNSVSCCGSNGCNTPDPVLDPATQLLPYDPFLQASSIKCYQTMELGDLISDDIPAAVYPATSSSNTAPGATGTADPTVCSSYQVDTCAVGMRNCSAAETAAGVWAWWYGSMLLSRCYINQWVYERGGFAVRNYRCCADDLCNKPNPATDNITRVMDVAPPEGGAISCFTSTNNTSAVQPVLYNSSVNLPSQYGVRTEPIICAAYKFGLCQPGVDCSGYEDIPGIGTFAYYPLPLSQCYQMQYLSQQPNSQFQNVTCCSTDDCNVPNAAVDGATQVTDMERALATTQMCPNSAYVSTPTAMGTVINWTISVTEATPFPGTHLAYITVTARLDPAWEQQQRQLGVRKVHWKSAVLPLKPARFTPPASYNIPAPFNVHTLGNASCVVSAVPAPVFGGMGEFYVHVDSLGTSNPAGAFVEVWGRMMLGSTANATQSGSYLGPSGWTMNKARFVSVRN